MISRRDFIAGTLATGAAVTMHTATALGGPRDPWPVRVGACVVNFEAARKAGIEGVQIDLALKGDRLEVADPAVRHGYKQRAQATGVSICGLMMGLLNRYPLARDPRGPAWLQQAIDAAKDLDAKVILVAFFANGDLLDGEGKTKPADVDAVVDRLKAAAPHAKDAGVILAIENYLNARQNLEILDRVGHDSVQVFYDVYNTGVTKGYDVPAEIRLLKNRIAQFHFKNGPSFLGEGKQQFPPIAAAIRDIGYHGWIILETSSPTHDAVADARRNGRYVRTLFGLQ